MKIYEAVLNGFAALAAILILAIMVGIGADVAARSFVGRPIGWILEYTEHSLLLILVLGMARLVRNGEHVGIDLFLNIISTKSAWILRTVANFLAGLSCLIVAGAGGLAARNDFSFGVETFGVYPIYRYAVMAAISLGMLLTAIEFFRLTARIFYGGPGDEVSADAMTMHPSMSVK